MTDTTTTADAAADDEINMEDLAGESTEELIERFPEISLLPDGQHVFETDQGVRLVLSTASGDAAWIEGSTNEEHARDLFAAAMDDDAEVDEDGVEVEPVSGYIGCRLETGHHVWASTSAGNALIINPDKTLPFTVIFTVLDESSRALRNITDHPPESKPLDDAEGFVFEPGRDADEDPGDADAADEEPADAKVTSEPTLFSPDDLDADDRKGPGGGPDESF